MKNGCRLKMFKFDLKNMYYHINEKPTLDFCGKLIEKS